jgi:hypothetical protein
MPQLNILDQWKQRTCTLATMHGKELAIAPIASKELGLIITVPTNFDTDRFGTFTRDIGRAGDQLESARAKALAAIEETGLDLAIASEGSFGSHPSIPFLPSNLEIILLVDTKHGIEVMGQHRSSTTRVQSQEVHTAADAVTIAQSWGFPEQGVIVRTSENSKQGIYKEIRTIDELKNISTTLLAKWLTKRIFLETDMRAHRCPARMDSIQAATRDLVKNCQSVCPECNTPGFVVTEVIKGLPCSDCALPTELATMLVYSCQKCLCTKNESIAGSPTADPAQCERCNP